MMSTPQTSFKIASAPKRVLLLLVAVDVLVELIRLRCPEDERSIIVILCKGQHSHGCAQVNLH
jgi:hypothetical protein